MSVSDPCLWRASLVLVLLAVRSDGPPAPSPAPGASDRTAVLWSSRSDNVAVRCELSPAAPLLSDDILFQLCVTVAGASVVAEFPDQVLYSGPVHVAATRIVREVTSEGAVRHCLLLKLVPEDRGTVRVGPTQIYLRDPSGTGPLRTLSVPEVQFAVRTLVPEQATTAAAEPPVGLLLLRPRFWRRAVAVLVVAVLLGGGAVAFWLVWRRERRPAVAEFESCRQEFLDAWNRLGDDETRAEATIAGLECVLGWVRRELGVQASLTEAEFLTHVRSSPELAPGVAARLESVLPVLERLKYDPNFRIDRAGAEQVIRTAAEAAQELYLERRMRTADAIGRRLAARGQVPQGAGVQGIRSVGPEAFTIKRETFPH